MYQLSKKFFYHKISPIIIFFLKYKKTKIKSLLYSIITLIILYNNSFSIHYAYADSLPEKQQIISLLRKVNNYYGLGNTVWSYSTYYIGNMALYNTCRDPYYLGHALQWAERHNWEIGDGPERGNANDQCCGQVYIDLYLIEPIQYRIQDIKTSVDNMVYGDNNEGWFYVDALFMAMPAFAKLGSIYNNQDYFDKMYELYTACKSCCYIEQDSLWYRDKRRSITPNGKNDYWSRGNGWAFGAITRVLQSIPDNEKHRDEYIKTFKKMAYKLKKIQRDDGFWNVSLLDPEYYGGPETSGTALFTYGIAWGVNNGILNKNEFLPVVTKAWNGMADKAVHPDGTVGYVQGVGDEPSDWQPVTYESSIIFGTGVFLLAGSEVFHLAEGETPVFSYVNLAVNTLSDCSHNKAKYALDGKNNTTWFFQYPQWIEVDLKKTYNIHRIEIQPYSPMALQYKVEAKKDSLDTYSIILNKQDNQTDKVWISEPLHSVDARFVRFTITGCYNCSDLLGLKEFKIFSIPKTDSLKITSYSKNQISLRWSVLPETEVAYNVYKDTIPFFIPDTENGRNRIGSYINDMSDKEPGIQWTDTDYTLDNIAPSWFYTVSCIDGNLESSCSNRVGVFNYNLRTTPETDFNEIALPLKMNEIHNARDLMNSIPYCNSVAKWNAALQIYEQFIPELELTNFNIQPGYPYYVNVTKDTIFTLSGEFVQPSFELITTPKTNFNEIMLPLDKSSINKASELTNNIPYCNSVAYWNTSDQGYEQYLPGLQNTDFKVHIGNPYYVNVTDNCIWPENTQTKIMTDRSLVYNKQSDVQGVQSPHIVWGNLNNPSFNTEYDNLSFTAYITSRPDEKLTEQSTGCMIGSNFWIVQCGNFDSPWKKGDLLRVEFCDENQSKIFVIEKELTYDCSDKADKICCVKDNNISANEFHLKQNFPNPFNNTTIITYSLLVESTVNISIYNTTGQIVKTILQKKKNPGSYQISWNGKDNNGIKVTSGVYIVHMTAEDYTENKKIILIK